MAAIIQQFASPPMAGRVKFAEPILGGVPLGREARRLRERQERKARKRGEAIAHFSALRVDDSQQIGKGARKLRIASSFSEVFH